MVSSARPLEASCDNVSLLACIVPASCWCAVACDNIWVVTCDVKGPAIPSAELSLPTNESVEMKSSSSVILSSNDTLRSKRSKMLNNTEGVEFSALRIGKEGVFRLESEFRARLALLDSTVSGFLASASHSASMRMLSSANSGMEGIT